jgi:hypothetical protein
MTTLLNLPLYYPSEGKINRVKERRRETDKNGDTERKKREKIEIQIERDGDK